MASLSRTECLALAAVLVVAAVLRLWGLDGNPPGLWGDEASTGYDAWTLLHFGTDQYGERFPIFFRSLDDYVAGLYRYLAIPFIAILGLTHTAIRLPSALASLLTVVLTFVFVRRFYDSRTALLAAALVAISPWALPYARSGHRVMLFPLFLAAALTTFVNRAGNTGPARIFFAGFFFGLSIFGYASGRLLGPLLFLAWLAVFREQIRKTPRGLLLAAAGFALCAVPFVAYAAVHPDRILARWEMVAGGDGGLTVTEFARNLLLHYDPRFLFVEGDINPRHSMLGYGQLHWIELPLLAVGLAFAIRERRPIDRFLLVVFALFAVPSALTRLGVPHGLRSIAAVPFLHVLAARGGTGLLTLLAAQPAAARALRAALAAGWIMTAIPFAYQLLVRYPVYAGELWSFGVREATAIAQAHAAGGGRVVWFTRRTRLEAEGFLFYTRPAPPGPEWTGERLGAFEFRKPRADDFADGRTLVILDPWAAEAATPLPAPDWIIRRPDGEIALLGFSPPAGSGRGN